MASPTIFLPCRAHPRGCASHRYWDLSSPAASSDNQSPATRRGVSARILDILGRRNPTFQNHSSKTSCKIQLLPNELLFTVYELLPRESQVAFVLTCRRFAVVLGPTAWKDVDWYSWQSIMNIHQKNLDPHDFWRCQLCQNFHRRQEIQRGQIAPPASNLPIENKKHRLRYGIPKDPVYTLDFKLIKRVMDGHFLGPAHGLCLHSLRCSGTRRYPPFQGYAFELHYSFTPKIVVDRLLLKSQYRFKPIVVVSRPEFEGQVFATVESTPIVLQFLKKLNFNICGHQKTDVVKTLLEKNPHEVENLRCPFCPTHFRAEVLARAGILLSLELSTWQNLGTGRDVHDVKWQHLSAAGAEKRLYKQDPGNVHKAFELIHCPKQKDFGELSESYRSLKWARGPQEFRYSLVGDHHSSDTAFAGRCLSTSLSDVAAQL